MKIKPLYRDPVTGYLLEATSEDTLGISVVAIHEEFATLFNNAEANTCCALIEYTAIPINSVNLPNVALRNLPYVDCIVLESGIQGQTVKVAATHGKLYSTPNNIVYTNSDILYLGRDSKITTTPPSLLNGDKWLVIVGRLVNPNQFVFDPQPPIDLTAQSGGYQGQIPSIVGNANRFLFTDGNTLLWKNIKQSDILEDAEILTFAPTSGTLEIGQSINTPSFIASYNELVYSLKLKDSINNIWDTINNFTNFNSSYNFSRNTVGSILFTIEATLSEVLQKTTQIQWLYRKFYGTSLSLTSINDLSYSSLASNRSGSFSVNAQANEYIYLAIPSSFGTPTFYVGGFEGGFNLDSTVNYINPYGITTNYNIYKSDNHSLGETTVNVI